MCSISGTPDFRFQVGLACRRPDVTGEERGLGGRGLQLPLGAGSHELALSLLTRPLTGSALPTVLLSEFWKPWPLLPASCVLDPLLGSPNTACEGQITNILGSANHIQMLLYHSCFYLLLH